MPRHQEPAKPDFRVKIVRFVLLAIFVGLGYNLTVGQYGFLNIFELRKQIKALQAEELQYTVQLVDLTIEKDRLLSDTLYIEKLARKQYQLGRPGETVIEF